MIAIRISALFAVLVLAATVSAGGAASTNSGPAKLTLDGVPFEPELALTSGQRALGLMHRRKAPADGMLFVFPDVTSGGFWMKNTLVPLTIAFYDARGNRVRKLSMKPCRKDPCPIYDPGRRYRFALELRASDTRPAATLGPTAQLARLSRRAS